jgi:hypothetical protein
MKALVSFTVLLLSCMPAFSADRAPPVFLSHFFVALDQGTYDAIKNAPQTSALAKAEARHTVAGSESWSGFYIYGRQTYIEFFGDAAFPSELVLGDGGIGLSVENAGGVEAVAARLRTVYGDKVGFEKKVRTTPSGDIPWFQSVSIPPNETAVLGTWIMEVDPGYLTAMHPGSRVKDPLSRLRYNSWYFRPEQELDDIVGLTLVLNHDEAVELAAELGLLGWSIRRNGAEFVAIGPDVKIRILLAGKHRGIQQAELRLRHSVPEQTFQLGNAQLHLGGKTGQLIFWAPP